MGTDTTRSVDAKDLSVTFESWYASAWPPTRRLAALLTQDLSAGEEVAQEALVVLYQRWGEIENPDAYLNRTVINMASNWRRHKGTARSKIHLLGTDGFNDLEANELIDAIADLPFRQRAVVVLRYYYDLQESEIADWIGCRPGTVKSLSSRALAQLSKKVPRR